jgi:hypothetical protein
MSLINTIKAVDRSTGVFSSTVGPNITTAPGSGALVSPYFGYDLATGGPAFRNFRISLVDLQGLGAFTTGDLILHVHDPGAMTQWSFVKPRIALTDAVGGSGANVTLSAATARLLSVPINSAANAAATHSYGTAFDSFQAVGNTVFDYDGLHPGIESVVAQTWMILRVTVTSINLSALTNGVIDVSFGYTNVPV